MPIIPWDIHNSFKEKFIPWSGLMPRTRLCPQTCFFRSSSQMRISEISLEFLLSRTLLLSTGLSTFAIIKAEGMKRKNSLLQCSSKVFHHRRGTVWVLLFSRKLRLPYFLCFKSIITHILSHSPFPFQSWEKAMILQSKLSKDVFWTVCGPFHPWTSSHGRNC